MKLLNLALASLVFALSINGVVADVATSSYEEVSVPLPSKHAQAIGNAKNNTFESHLAVVLPLEDKYEILGMLRTESSWFVISRIRQTGNLLFSRGGQGGGSFRKTGFGKSSGYHVVRAIDENRRTLEYNIGDEFKDVSDIITVSCDGGELAISTKREQAGTGQPATRPESKSEVSDKPQPNAEGRSQ